MISKAKMFIIFFDKCVLFAYFSNLIFKNVVYILLRKKYSIKNSARISY